MAWARVESPPEELIAGSEIPPHAKSVALYKALARGATFWRHQTEGQLALYRPDREALVTWIPFGGDLAGLPPVRLLHAPSASAGWREVGQSVRQIVRVGGSWERTISPQLRRHMRSGAHLPSRLVWFPRTPEADAEMLAAIAKFVVMRVTNTYDHHANLRELLALPPFPIRTGVLEIGPHRAFFLVTEFSDVVSADVHFTFVAPGARLNLTTLLHQALIGWTRAKGIAHYQLGVYSHTGLRAYDGVTAYKRLWRGDLYPTVSYERGGA